MKAEWPHFFASKVVRAGFGSARLSTFVLALEAWRRGLEVTIRDSGLTRFHVSDGSREIEFNYSCPVSMTPQPARASLRDKGETKRLLEIAGVPVPAGTVLRTSETNRESLRRVAEGIGYPVTIKPLTGSKGEGVYTGISSWSELDRKFSHLIQSSQPKEVLIEENMSGDDYRLLVIGDKMVAACKRIPAHVIGDGKHSVEGLIEKKNAERRKNPFLSRGLIRIDFEVEELLKEQNLGLSTVIDKGKYVALRRIANASAGGDVVDVTATIPKEVSEAAVAAVAAAPGILVAGVDFLYDPAASGGKSAFSIIEMNYRPHIGVNMYPTQGIGQDAPGHMIDYFFPDTHRPTSNGEEKLVFNWTQLRRELGTTKAITIPAAPDHRCPYRRRAVIRAPKIGLTASTANQLEKQFQALDVHGYIGVYRGAYLVVVGGEEAAVKEALDFALEVTQGTSIDSSLWRGRVLTDFEVRPNVVARPREQPAAALSRLDGRSYRVSLVGDVLLHGNLLRIGQEGGDYSYSRQFGALESEISNAACASVNLETIAAGEDYGLSGFPRFNAPEQLLDGLRGSGFGVLSVANNHMLDKGAEALDASVENIRRRGLEVSGAGATPEQLTNGAVIDLNGSKIGFVSFTDASKLDLKGVDTSKINVFPGENSQSKMVRRKNVIKKQVDAMRSMVDVVVLQLHFGEEYHRSPSAFQRELVATLCELDVDVIAGHHPHVLQPIEWVENSRGKKVLVAYSLGNYFSGQLGIHRQIGGIFSFSVNRVDLPGGPVHRIENPEVLLTYVDHEDEFIIKRMSDIVDTSDKYSGHAGGQLDMRGIYADSVSRLTSLAGDVRVR